MTAVQSIAALAPQITHPDLDVDWFLVITLLERAGLTLRAIAEHCNDVAEGTVRYWKQGGQPRFSDGALLVCLFISTLPSAPLPFTPKRKNLHCIRP